MPPSVSRSEFPRRITARNPLRMLVWGAACTDLVASACHCAAVACPVHCICPQEPPRPEDVFISGTDGVSLASGFHYYLKYVANRWGTFTEPGVLWLCWAHG